LGSFTGPLAYWKEFEYRLGGLSTSQTTADEECVDPLIGAKLGPRRVEERLAAGGMGVVYRARHTLLDQDVAVKILAPSLAADQQYVTRFFREAGAAGPLDQPNVIRVIDVGKFEDHYYLVLEYVAGVT